MIKKFYDGQATESGGDVPKSTMTVKQVYDFIVSKITAEEALMKLLQSTLVKYDLLKFRTTDEMVHPEIIIAMAALDLGWDMIVEKSNQLDAPLEGIIIGNSDYIKRTFANFKDSNNEKTENNDNKGESLPTV